MAVLVHSNLKDGERLNGLARSHTIELFLQEASTCGRFWPGYQGDMRRYMDPSGASAGVIVQRRPLFRGIARRSQTGIDNRKCE